MEPVGIAFERSERTTDDLLVDNPPAILPLFHYIRTQGTRHVPFCFPYLYDRTIPLITGRRVRFCALLVHFSLGR